MASQQPDRARPNCRSRTSCQSPVQVSRRGRYLVHPANPTSHHSTDKRSASRYILDPTWRWRLWTLRAEHTRATSSTILSACTFDTLAQLQSFSRSLAEERKGGSQCPCQAEARCGASPVDRPQNCTASGPEDSRHTWSTLDKGVSLKTDKTGEMRGEDACSRDCKNLLAQIQTCSRP